MWVIKSQGVETSWYKQTVNKPLRPLKVVAIVKEKQNSVLNPNWSLLIEVKQDGTL